MNQLSTRFILSNVIAAGLLIYFGSGWKDAHHALVTPGSDAWFGVFIYLATVMGIVANAYKAYDLAYQTKNAFKWFEQLFLFIIYVFGFAGGMVMIFVGFQYMGDYEFQMEGGVLILQLFTGIAAFVLLVLESYFFQYRPKKPLSKFKRQFANFGSTTFSGIGISVLWNAFILGSDRYMHSTVIEFLGYSLLMIALVFPFQRLFWYEVLGSAESKIDHLKTFGAILLVILSGVVPLYFV